ncbi:hypothetical protein [Hyphococcus sp.]|uniref:hypothetical protein n=1 Tax=Hyphococcus sp. TaxID=2038636 RepID=UPI0035C78ADC
MNKKRLNTTPDSSLSHSGAISSHRKERPLAEESAAYQAGYNAAYIKIEQIVDNVAQKMKARLNDDDIPQSDRQEMIGQLKACAWIGVITSTFETIAPDMTDRFTNSNDQLEADNSKKDNAGARL